MKYEVSLKVENVGFETIDFIFYSIFLRNLSSQNMEIFKNVWSEIWGKKYGWMRSIWEDKDGNYILSSQFLEIFGNVWGEIWSKN